MKDMVNALRHPNKEVDIALVGKYIQLHDAYLSVVAIKTRRYCRTCNVNIHWVDSEELNEENVDEVLGSMQGILVPGGFGGSRGVEGKILAKYARENKIPYLGLCLGMQVAIIEFARNVGGFHDAHSIRVRPNTTHPFIALIAGSGRVEDIGGTSRLGAYPCELTRIPKPTLFAASPSPRKTSSPLRSQQRLPQCTD